MYFTGLGCTRTAQVEHAIMHIHTHAPTQFRLESKKNRFGVTAISIRANIAAIANLAMKETHTRQRFLALRGCRD